MGLDIEAARRCIQEFRFQDLFIDELGWSRPSQARAGTRTVGEESFTLRRIAELAGVPVFEVECEGRRVPDAKTCAALQKEVAKDHHEHLLIFVDGGRERTQSLWYWAKRQDGKTHPREHLYMRGQPGDLFLSKLGAMHFELGDFDESGGVPLVEVAKRLRDALDVERTTKRFYAEFQNQHLEFLKLIRGIDDERDRRWYASVLLNRLMFVYFLQKKGFVDGGRLNYLQEKLAESREAGKGLFYARFLKALFFEGFAKPEEKRSPEARALLGRIRYLNGGLFLPHPIEQRRPNIAVPDKAFENLFALFAKYSWSLNDAPGGKDDELNPDVLGYIFEKYINQKAFGAYYTRPEITEYLCERTIHRLILDAVNGPEAPGEKPGRRFESMAELLLGLDGLLCRRLLREILPGLSLLDPACGSGAFLVAAMKTLIDVYAAVIGRIEFLADKELSGWLEKVRREHASVNYYIKKRIITDNLFGVDIMEEATEIAKLRLFLTLVSSAASVEQLEPLPNIDFNILPGNSLIGLLTVDPKSFDHRGSQGSFNFGSKSYRKLLEEKNRWIDGYRHAATYADDLTTLRDNIQAAKAGAVATLNGLLLDEFSKLGVRYEEATWDAAKGKEGKSKKRLLEEADIRALQPFHWGYEFDEVLEKRGGFDAIITNPPWEIFKPNAKEFFEEHSELVTKNKMTIHEFEKEKAKLLRDGEVRAAWLEYLGGYPHVSAYYRAAPEYGNQISVVNGKKSGTDINLYKLFIERCFRLLRQGGYCGIVVPSGVYTDLGTKQLREMLFSETTVTGLFCFENRKEVFEGVHRSFKFVVLTFEKGGKTKRFPAAFMRHEVAELDRFPKQGALEMPVDLIRRLSPDSLSVMEFKTPLDVQIAKKVARFRGLGESTAGAWQLVLGRELDMTNDSGLFEQKAGKGRAPLVQGGMFHQFDAEFAPPKYWIDLDAGRRRLLGRQKDLGQKLGYQGYRIVHRRIARNTDERTLIATVIPPLRFCADTAQAVKSELNAREMILVTALFNAFVTDYQLRQRVTTHADMHFMYALRLPRPDGESPEAREIVERAARLICTTPEFDDLARSVGLKGHEDGATAPEERARLRAELDGLIAHVYGLTEEEFAHILATFPLVDRAVKDAAMEAYRALAPGAARRQGG